MGQSDWMVTGVARGPRAASQMLIWASAAFVLASVLFVMTPQADIATAGLFYRPDHGFAGKVAWVEGIRSAFKALYVASLVLALAALGWAWLQSDRRAGSVTRRALVIVLVLVVGPGLVANVLLKDQMGRARPAQTDLFGGTKAFTPPLVPAGQCRRNCSFVSGEAASMFALFFGLAVVSVRRARAMVAAGVVVGATVGLIRMSQGAHFLSDVVFAGIFMAMTAAALKVLVMDMWPSGSRRPVPGLDPAVMR